VTFPARDMDIVRSHDIAKEISRDMIEDTIEFTICIHTLSENIYFILFSKFRKASLWQCTYTVFILRMQCHKVQKQRQRCLKYAFEIIVLDVVLFGARTYIYILLPFLYRSSLRQFVFFFYVV